MALDLLIAYFVATAVTNERVASQVTGGVAIAFVLATFYLAYRSVGSGEFWRGQLPRDAGATASLEFYGRELVRERNSIAFVGWRRATSWPSR